MVSARMRPRFQMQVTCSASETLSAISDELAEPECPCVGDVVGRHVHLQICEPERRIWSPHLVLEVERQDVGALIHGHFGPRVDIWSFFVALYAISAFTVMVGLIFGYSQWTLGSSPVGFWAVPAALVLAGIVYALALTGQKLSQGQMHQLRDFVEDAVGEDYTEAIIIA